MQKLNEIKYRGRNWKQNKLQKTLKARQIVIKKIRIKIDINTNLQDNCFLRGLVQNSRRGERKGRGKEKKTQEPTTFIFYLYLYLWKDLINPHWNWL